MCVVTGLPVHIQPSDTLSPKKIAILSCYDSSDNHSAVWNDVVSQGVDLALWIGDNIYADTTDMGVMRSKYDAKKMNQYYSTFMSANIPVMASWDDHDMGGNNQGKNYPKRQESQAEFVRHFDLPTSDPRATGAQLGVYSEKLFSVDGVNVHIVMLDNRYHRSPTYKAYGPCEGDSSTMLGDVQWSWLQNTLRNTKTDITVITSGIQVLPPTYLRNKLTDYCAYDASSGLFESSAASVGDSPTSESDSFELWSEIPQERTKLLRLVQEVVATGKTKLVVFASGDQHWAELQRKEIPADVHRAVTVYEVTASGINQNWQSGEKNANRYPVWCDTSGNGVYDQKCVFPYKASSGKSMYGCSSAADTSIPSGVNRWCARSLTSKGRVASWGVCAPEGSTTPDGFAGYSQVQGDTPYLLNSEIGNWGLMTVNASSRTVRLELRTPYGSEAVGAYTVLKF